MLHFLQQGSMQIRVMENQQYRWLLFDDYLQTVMDKASPSQPVLPHIHAMLLALYYQNTPIRVVELGLGGGALARYFEHMFPSTAMTSVEFNEPVVDNYKKYFNPTNTHKIIIGDAQLRIRELSQIDLLFVDLFDASGSPDFVYESSFYKHCLNALSDKGVLIINEVPSLQMQADVVFDLVKELVNVQPDVFSAPGFKNRILLIPTKLVAKELHYNDELLAFADKFGVNLNCITKIR